ncbi:hypothetical protein [Gimesia sp.]|uniref:hypothetical protein n=1 Tax=Gimesia sp. TaxID=2024833 RepID=UPI003A8FE00F
MRAAYFITDDSVTLKLLFESIKRVPDCIDIQFNNKLITLEIIKPEGEYEFLKIEEETRESLLDEWYENDAIFERLLNNPLIPGQTRPFYLTFSHLIQKSKLLYYVTQSLIADSSIKFIIFDCMIQLYQPSEFLERLKRYQRD